MRVMKITAPGLETNLNDTDESPGAALLSLEEAYRLHHERVFAAAYRVTGNAQEAEDVLQAVFFRLLKRTPSGEGLDLGRNPASYLARAAINAALDILRTKRRAQVVQLDEVREAGSNDSEAVDEVVDREHRRALLRGAVARLEGQAAEMVALRFFEGYSNTEIAEMLQTSASQVGVVLHRARDRLKKDLGLLDGVTS